MHCENESDLLGEVNTSVRHLYVGGNFDAAKLINVHVDPNVIASYITWITARLWNGA